MIKKIVIAVCGLVYDGLFAILVIPALVGSLFLRKVRKYMAARSSIFTILKSLHSIKEKEVVYFFCSSIGELEQAIPVLEKIEQKKLELFIFFHSQNGYNHAKMLGYKNIAITPFDLFSIWVVLFLSKKVSFCVINRHEYWPGFVFASLIWSKLYIINAVQKQQQSLPEKWWRNWIYRNCIRVFFVNNILENGDNNIYSGDTRIDRLVQRKNSELRECEALRTCICTDSKKILVIGNAYTDDINVLAKALDIYPEILYNWKVLIIPSRPEMADKMINMFADKTPEDSIRIIPVIGKLFQYYSCADLAWVGGGFSQSGIHNTLEPLFFGIRIISGPNLNHQPDAIMFKKQNLLQTFTSSEEVSGLLNYIPDIIPNAITDREISPTQLIINEIFSL